MRILYDARFRWVVLGSLFVALALGGLTAHGRAPSDEAPANRATERIHREAHRILDNIEATSYKHQTDIDEEKGVYRCDCSGLGIYILCQTVAEDSPADPLGDGKRRPRAVDFHDAFVNASANGNGAGRWQRVNRLVDARPGDFIAWRREKLVPGEVTGHVIVVDAKPVQEKDGLVRVVMIDSTTKPQSDDTRKNGDTGIGRGTMWFEVDEAGRPVGYIRGGLRNAEPKHEPIAIGRAIGK